MNIQRFKEKAPRKQYIVVLDFYNVNGEIDYSQYIACADYTEATNFLEWVFNSCKSNIIDEYIDNAEKYDNCKRERDEFEFELWSNHEYARIYDCEYELRMNEIHLEKLEDSTDYISRGWIRG